MTISTYQFKEDKRFFVKPSSPNDFSSTAENFARVTELFVDQAWTSADKISVISEKPTSSTKLDISILSSINNPFNDVENKIIDCLGYEKNEEIGSIKNDLELYKIISIYREFAILVISNLIDTERVKFLQAIHILSFLGEIRHMPTFLHRTWLLEKNLKSKSKYIRDGASLGILYLENPSTINSIKEAISIEKNPQLQKNMIQVLESLEKKS